jgi:hypothetical protein
MADPIARLARLRTAEADAARRDLATAMRAAEAAAAAVAGAQAALSHEARNAPADPTHALAGAYAAWLPAGRAAIARARAEEATRAVGVHAARVTLAAARMALRACENLAEAQAAERRAADIKSEQLMLEDVTRRG